MTIKKTIEEKIIFDKKKHTYTGTVSKEDYISTTKLLKMFDLAPTGYDAIPKAILAKKAEYGTTIHKAIEEYLKGDETQVIIPEVRSFANWLIAQSMTVLDCESEQIVFNEEYKIAGTVDLQIWNIIGDFKTTAALHIVPVMWQLSVYTFLLHPDESKYSMYSPKAFWFAPDGTLSVKEIPLIPYNRVVNMLDAYKAGKSTWIDTSVPESLKEKVDELIKHNRLIHTITNNLQTLKAEKEAMQEKLKAQMKKEKRIYVETPTGVATITEVTVQRYDTSKVNVLLATLGKEKKDYCTTTEYTRISIKDRRK